MRYLTIFVTVFVAFFGGYMVCLGTGLQAEELVSRPLLYGGIFIACASSHILAVLTAPKVIRRNRYDDKPEEEY